MIDRRTQLDVLYDADGTFTDYTVEAVDFSRDEFSATLNQSTDYLYFGYYKPINAIYFEIATANTNSGNLDFEYYNGSAWTALTVRDETNDLSRSGYITWTRPTDQAETSVNGTTKYWVRCRPDASTTNVTFQGINLVFSDDNALKQEFYEIDDTSLIPSGQNSHIMSHISARNDIMQRLRNMGMVKYNSTTGEESLTQWDLLNIYEIREAAKYLALSKIFFSLSDELDDVWYRKHAEYSDKYEQVFQGLQLTIDSDDDGAEDDAETRNKRGSTRFTY